MADAEKHFGTWLKREIARAGMTQTEFLDRSGLKRATVLGWFREDGPRPQSHQLKGIAEGLGRDVADVERVFEATDQRGPTVTIPVLNEPGRSLRVESSPELAGAVSAGTIAEREEGGDEAMQFNARTQFILRVDGDCMEPDWMHGELVLFDKRPVETEGIIDGEDYALRFAGDEGKTTFKRVYKDPRDPGVFVLRCVNRGRHGQQLRVSAEDVVMAGKAMYALTRRRGRMVAR